MITATTDEDAIQTAIMKYFALILTVLILLCVLL